MRPHEALHNLSQAMSLIVGGVYVLSLRAAAGDYRGIVLSFVQQVSFDPPRIAIALHKERTIVTALGDQASFVLGIVAADSATLADELASSPDDPAAVIQRYGAREVGPGLVPEQAAGFLVCQVQQRVDIGDHWLYIAQVLEGAAVPSRQPLLHVRSSGLRY